MLRVVGADTHTDTRSYTYTHIHPLLPKSGQVNHMTLSILSEVLIVNSYPYSPMKTVFVLHGATLLFTNKVHI